MPEEKIIKGAGFMQIGDIIKTRLSKGEITSRITEVKKNG
jgi:hypothetical protein